MVKSDKIYKLITVENVNQWVSKAWFNSVVLITRGCNPRCYLKCGTFGTTLLVNLNLWQIG